MTYERAEAIRRFGIPLRAYLEVKQVLLRSDPADIDGTMWELLRCLSRSGFEIREKEPEPGFITEPTEEFPLGSECPLHKRQHNSHGWYVCVPTVES